MKKVLLLLSISGFLTSCVNDNLEEMHPTAPPCDTTGVISFATDIQPIMDLHCGTNDIGCHINSSADGACGFANYTDMMNYLQSASDDTRFLNTIKQENISVSLYMPKDATKLDDCSINKIQAWIDRGKPNN